PRPRRWPAAKPQGRSTPSPRGGAVVATRYNRVPHADLRVPLLGVRAEDDGTDASGERTGRAEVRAVREREAHAAHVSLRPGTFGRLPAGQPCRSFLAWRHRREGPEEHGPLDAKDGQGARRGRW